MANPGALSPHLPAAPLTAEQKALFDSHLNLVKSMTNIGVRKYGTPMKQVVKSAAMTGLMCAASRYRVPSKASFKTFAIHTINWAMRLDVRRELGLKEGLTRSREVKRKQPTYEPSAYRTTGDLPEAFFDFNLEETVLVDVRTPEELLLAAERQYHGQLVVSAAQDALPPRWMAIMMRKLDDEGNQELADEYGISRQRVDQLSRKAFARAVEAGRATLL